jgi:heme O synthase-like polyprenyltransferase
MLEFLELTKPRITLLIVFCSAVGYFFGRVGSFDVSIFAYVVIGTALMASGAAALKRHVLLASVLYLPILFAAMVLNSQNPKTRRILPSANKDRLQRTLPACRRTK